MRAIGYFAYILACADGTLYTGWTVDPAARLDAHNAGKGAKYTRARLPVRLLHAWEFDSQTEAMRFERTVKALSRKGKERLLSQAGITL